MAETAKPTPGSPLKRPLPYEEEAKLLNDVVDFFIHKLPHAVDDAAEHLDEARVSNYLFERLSMMSDGDLAARGLKRSDISKAAGCMAGLLKLAHQCNQYKNTSR